MFFKDLRIKSALKIVVYFLVKIVVVVVVENVCNSESCANDVGNLKGYPQSGIIHNLL